MIKIQKTQKPVVIKPGKKKLKNPVLTKSGRIRIGAPAKPPIIEDETFPWDILPPKLRKFYSVLVRQAFGNISFACELSRTGRKTIYHWIKANKVFADFMNEDTLDDYVQDEVEKWFIMNDLTDKDKGGGPARKFWLQSRHKKYKQKIGIELPQGAIVVNFKGNVPRPERKKPN